MFIDGNFLFGLPAITNSNTATVSTNVLDAGSAVKMFGGPNVGKINVRCPVTADASPSIKVDLVGADNAALSSNPVVIASSGVVATDEAGAALTSGGVVDIQFGVGYQTAAKQFYGLIYTLGGTNPDTVADTKQGFLVRDAQSNMQGARAAVP